jgi:hypothetical protein
MDIGEIKVIVHSFKKYKYELGHTTDGKMFNLPKDIHITTHETLSATVVIVKLPSLPSAWEGKPNSTYPPLIKTQGSAEKSTSDFRETTDR